MPSRIFIGKFPAVTLLVGLNALFVLLYVGIMAIVMSYATMQIEFAQSVRTDEASVAMLESSYLTAVDQVTQVNYLGQGYGKPTAELFVTSAAQTAFNVR
jgi:hypothetical protein